MLRKALVPVCQDKTKAKCVLLKWLQANIFRAATIEDVCQCGISAGVQPPC